MVDGTLGAGGHAAALLTQHSNLKYIGNTTVTPLKTTVTQL
jgi:16S rRNA C1402 N4-methylase RsmH